MSAATVARGRRAGCAGGAQAPGQIATLILPQTQRAGSGASSFAPTRSGTERVSQHAIDDVAQALCEGRRSAMLLRGSVLDVADLKRPAASPRNPRANIVADNVLAPDHARGGTRGAERFPYFAEQIVEFLRDFELLILAGSKPPVRSLPSRQGELVRPGRMPNPVFAHPH